ncbi:scavenger receptor cysteine-rich type 1 protein M130-like isoform X4 [Lytechinus pictus]|uniref:scavenger receptor cysteine-rich type 1 protein M130-like isoform X4 n=1 Tax=Lytechinus pictus TaxID=7653 RepID=UPI0030B9D31C
MEAFTIFSLLLFAISLSSSQEIRLAGHGSNIRQGRVEIFFEGRWGTICDDDWDLADADVVCRQFGYAEGAVAACTMMSCGFPRPNDFGEGSGPIWLDNVRCVGTEERITDCPANPIGDQNCMHFEDAGVICKGDRGADSTDSTADDTQETDTTDTTTDDTQETDSTDNDTVDSGWRPLRGGGLPKKRQEDLASDVKREEALVAAMEQAEVMRALSDLMRDLRRK